MRVRAHLDTPGAMGMMLPNQRFRRDKCLAAGPIPSGRDAQERLGHSMKSALAPPAHQTVLRMTRLRVGISRASSLAVRFKG